MLCVHSTLQLRTHRFLKISLKKRNQDLIFPSISRLQGWLLEQPKRLKKIPSTSTGTNQITKGLVPEANPLEFCRHSPVDRWNLSPCQHGERTDEEGTVPTAVPLRAPASTNSNCQPLLEVDTQEGCSTMGSSHLSIVKGTHQELLRGRLKA